MAGRTPVPEKEGIAEFARHHASMAIFLSTGMLRELAAELVRGGYKPQTPAALVYKASWPEEKALRCTVAALADVAEEHGIGKTALVLVGDFLGGAYSRSKLYDPGFSTEFREAARED